MKVSGLFPLRFLLPSLPRGAAEPAIVQEEPGAQGAYHGAHGTSRRPVINYQFPLASRSNIGSPGREHAELPPVRPGPRSGSGEDAEAAPECECAGGRAGEASSGRAGVPSRSRAGAGAGWRWERGASAGQAPA